MTVLTNHRVVDVSNRLLSGNKDIRQIYDKTWTVTVVDQNVKNAFVLPCGNIFVFTGMLDLCENDDQVLTNQNTAMSTNHTPAAGNDHWPRDEPRHPGACR